MFEIICLIENTPAIYNTLGNNAGALPVIMVAVAASVLCTAIVRMIVGD